jgi:aspartyl-tRNA(Asn)/glutamyl-tRNA(Gln) amidotransferase subunit A
MSGAPLWKLSATELSRRYAASDLSPVEVLDAVLDRCEAVNPRLNAVITLDKEGAKHQARASAARWRAGTPLGPVDGVPLTVKDNLLVGGMRATWGSPLYADYVPAADELPVARLRAQGAVILGKTNVPEFTLQGYTDNPLFGPTGNPWDPSVTPGGSSGGAVAAVASGVGPLAIGTDGGGSTRRPASHAGLVGLKPTPGRIPRADGFPPILHNFEVIGPIARTTADLALLFTALAGPDRRDPTSLLWRKPEPRDRPSVGMRILYVPRFGESPVNPEITESVAEAAETLERLGHHVTAGEAPFDLSALDRIWSVIGPAGLAWAVRDRPEWRDLVSAPLQAMAEAGRALTASDYVAALVEVAKLQAHFTAFFAAFDVVLTPSAAAQPWPANVAYPNTISGERVGPRGHAVFTAFANAAALPGISVPARPSRSGLPIGFQLVGPPGADEELLALSAAYEEVHPWSDRWPGI